MLSNVFVPTSGMPTWLRAIADWNPVSTLAAALRERFDNPTRQPTGHGRCCIPSWPPWAEWFSWQSRGTISYRRSHCAQGQRTSGVAMSKLSVACRPGHRGCLLLPGVVPLEVISPSASGPIYRISDFNIFNCQAVKSFENDLDIEFACSNSVAKLEVRQRRPALSAPTFNSRRSQVR